VKKNRSHLSRDVPPEIAVCPECGRSIRHYSLDGERVICFCLGAEHAPEQSVEMLEKWFAVEVAVTRWLDSLQ
jgi:hypothetical protein